MLCLDVPPPGVLFDIVDAPLTPHHLHQGNILIDIQGAFEAIFLLLLWIIPGIYSSPTKTLSPPHHPTLPCSLVVAQLSANLKCRPPWCYWCNHGTPVIPTPSVYQEFYFRFSTCSHVDDHWSYWLTAPIQAKLWFNAMMIPQWCWYFYFLGSDYCKGKTPHSPTPSNYLISERAKFPYKNLELIVGICVWN